MRMAKLTYLLTLVIALAAVVTAQERKLPIAPIGPLPAFHPQEPKRIQLPNGMVIFLQEDHELPIIDGFARIRGGSRSEPAAKVGLAQIYGQTWRTGGTKTQTGDQLDDFLEVRAAKVETGPGPDSATISFSCLKSDLDDVFKAFQDVLQNPEFRDDKIDIAKKGEEDGISRRNDDASGIAGREAALLVYGTKSPYAREAQYATIDAVTLSDFKAWHDSTVVPNNMIVAVSGDFDGAAMEAKLRGAFGSLAKGKAIRESKMEFPGPKPGVYAVDKTDVNQSNVIILGLGTERSNPDYYALSVMNEIFAGGFGPGFTRTIAPGNPSTEPQIDPSTGLGAMPYRPATMRLSLFGSTGGLGST